MKKRNTKSEIEKKGSMVLSPISSIYDTEKNGRHIFSSAKGIFIEDIDGKKYLDAGAGLWCMNLGYAREDVAETISKSITHTGGYFNAFSGNMNIPQANLSEKIIGLLHKSGMEKMHSIFYGCTGSDANDTQLKIVNYYFNSIGKPQKRKIIKRKGAYHGTSISTASLSGIPLYRNNFNFSEENIIETECPHYISGGAKFDDEKKYSKYLASELEKLIMDNSPDEIGAFIAEPIMGAGGVIIPPENYFSEIKKILVKYDILLLADEVICGFGRTGKWFGSELQGIDADMISFAKGLTGAYFPLSAVAISKTIYNSLSDFSKENGIFPHGYTYSGHPTGCAVALKSIEIIENEGLIENSRNMGEYLLSCLKQELGTNSNILDIRGRGLLIGVEFHDDMHKTVALECKKDGLLVRPLPWLNVTAFSPPLIINKNDVNCMVETYTKAVKTISS